MLVFFSWSGTRSKAIAEALSSWLAQVVQAVEPWLSRDIAKGARWGAEVNARLEASRVGIVCLTPDNIHADWIHFEAGALSKTKDAYVCTFLTGLKPADVEEPLAQFQHTQSDESDVKRLVQTINDAVRKAGEKALGEGVLDEVFQTYWPRLTEKLNAIPTGDASPEPVRPEREILEEILEIIRRQERTRRRSEHDLSRALRVSPLAREFGWDRILRDTTISPDFLEYIIRRNAERRSEAPAAPSVTAEPDGDKKKDP